MTGHDPLSPAALHDPACSCSALAEREAQARADERERVNREAQDAVARIIPQAGRHSIDLCLAWQDGWQTGHDVATGNLTANPDTAAPVGAPRHDLGLCLCGHELDDHAIADLPRCHRCACFGYRRAPRSRP